MRDHDELGETAYVLKVDDSDPMQIQAEIRIDHADRIEFMPMVQESTESEARALALHPDEKRAGILATAALVVVVGILVLTTRRARQGMNHRGCLVLKLGE